MATIINLDVEKIKEINTEINSSSTALLNTHLPELNSVINQIKSNVLNDQINAILVDISTRFENISTELKADIPRLEQFLSDQMGAYQTTEDEAEQELNDALNEMGGDSGQSVGGGTSGGTAGGTTTTEKKKPGFWEYHGGNFAEAWTSQDWAGAWDYSGCDSGLDYVGTTVDALLDSAGNLVDGLLDTGGAAVNFTVDCVTEFLGWLF